MSDQLTLAPDPLAVAEAWRRKHPRAWRAVVLWAHEDREQGIDPSTRLYCCLLRRPHFASRLGLTRSDLEPVLVNDHLSADLARLLNREYPYLKCPTRRAYSDTWGGAA